MTLESWITRPFRCYVSATQELFKMIQNQSNEIEAVKMQNLFLKAELERNKSDIEMLKAAIGRGTNQTQK